MIDDPNTDLNPAQKAFLEELGAPASQRPDFAGDLRHHLRAAIETAVGHHLDVLPPGEIVFLSKHRLALLHGCEARFLAEESQTFAWNIPIARGTITHKAIELALNWRREIEPSNIIDETIARYEEDLTDFGNWLQSCTELERAELRSDALDVFIKFLECFPPLKSSWRPVTESRLRAELCEGRLVLAGKTDLTLGSAVGQRAGKVIIDLKTGGFAPSHVEDLRFYALIETLRLGVPPRLIASYYLDQATLLPEVVTEDLLYSALDRAVQGAQILIKLHHLGSTPNKRPSHNCRWCPIIAVCDEGADFLKKTDL